MLGEGVELGDGVSFGSFVVVHAGCSIGDGCVIGDHAVLGKRPQLARGSSAHGEVGQLRLGAGVTVGTGAIVLGVRDGGPNVYIEASLGLVETILPLCGIVFGRLEIVRYFLRPLFKLPCLPTQDA